jgi:hypothetical protein
MKEAFIYRLKALTDDQGTIGIFSVPALGWSCFVNELPDRDNRSNLSRIPAGDYTVSIRQSPKYGLIFHVKDVKGRSWILFHSGNYAGDILKGWKTHSKGCILLGRKVGVLGRQRVVLNSRSTLAKFMDMMDNETFKLKIA